MTSLATHSWGTGPETVVLIHGFGGCGVTWEPVARRLEARATLIAYDLPGHAGSLHYPDAGPAKVASRAILADLAARGLARAHVAGHSMGGAIAVLMALADPARIASLTLLAPGGFGDEINGRLLARYAVASEPAEIERCLEGMVGYSSPIPPETIETLEAMRALPGQTAMLSSIAAMIARDGKQGAIPRERIAALPMPAAVAWGKLDGVLPPHHAEGLPDRFEVLRVAGAGHMLIEEAPDAVAGLIARTAGL